MSHVGGEVTETCHHMIITLHMNRTATTRGLETTVAFDMEMWLLIWSYILLHRDYIPDMTMQRSRQRDKHTHLCHASLSSPDIPRGNLTFTLFSSFLKSQTVFCVNYIWMRMTHTQRFNRSWALYRRKFLNAEWADMKTNVLSNQDKEP